jgi:glyoxylase-like metal-dependent hydrolase (beta-lactamase superfamily II)
MESSLERVAALDPALTVYPGHGPATTIGDELETNPYLTGVARPLRR